MAGKDRAADRGGPHLGGRGVLLPGPLTIARGAVLSTRPVQWTKSLLMFLPLAFSVKERWSLDDPGILGELFLQTLAGGLIFCAISGAVYVINDLFDREKDRSHPRKRRRPIASGQLPVTAAQALAVLLVVVALAGGFLLGTGLGLVCVVFLVLNLGYSAYLKRIIILDVMVVAAGYLLRVVTGALIIDVTVSPWLYSTIGVGALFIAVGKRHAELRTAGTDAPSQRAVLEQYSQAFLSQLLTITSTAALVAYAFYTFTATNVPENHSMMLTVPFVVFGLFRYLYLVNQTDEAESPELVIIRDVPLAIDVLLWAAAAIIILAVNR